MTKMNINQHQLSIDNQLPEKYPWYFASLGSRPRDFSIIISYDEITIKRNSFYQLPGGFVVCSEKTIIGDQDMIFNILNGKKCKYKYWHPISKRAYQRYMQVFSFKSSQVNPQIKAKKMQSK